MKPNDVEQYLGSLPRLQVDDTFSFSCGPTLACFNDCCRDLTLILSPYDMLRLRRSLGLSSKAFLKDHAGLTIDQSTGFPQVALNMGTDENHICPFVEEQGCAVYEHRPSACRTYPLGRGIGYDDNGEIVVHYLMVQEAFCRGFKEQKERTVKEWMTDQGMDEYIDFGDRHTKLLYWWRKKGCLLSKSQFGIVFTALYRPDAFLAYIEHENLLADLAESTRAAIQTDETERLVFALDWLETSYLAGLIDHTK